MEYTKSINTHGLTLEQVKDVTLEVIRSLPGYKSNSCGEILTIHDAGKWIISMQEVTTKKVQVTWQSYNRIL